MKYINHHIYKMKNKIYLILMLGIFLISFTSASCPDGDDCIGKVKLDNSIEIYQTCNNCTYCNFTKVKYPNKEVFLSNIIASEDGTYFYSNILGGNNSELGEYEYCYDCGNAVEKETGCLHYLVTPTGFIDTLGFYIVLLVVLGGIVVLGFSINEAWFVVLGGLGFIMLGIYSINFGVVGFRDMFMTWGLGLFEIAVGAILSIGAGIQKLYYD